MLTLMYLEGLPIAKIGELTGWTKTMVKVQVHRARGKLKKLDLSDDQARQVESILSKHQKQIQSIRRECQPRFERQIDEIRTEISAVLKPEQARKWDRWLDDKRRTWLPPVPESAPGP